MFEICDRGLRDTTWLRNWWRGDSFCKPRTGCACEFDWRKAAATYGAGLGSCAAILKWCKLFARICEGA